MPLPAAEPIEIPPIPAKEFNYWRLLNVSVNCEDWQQIKLTACIELCRYPDGLEGAPEFYVDESGQRRRLYLTIPHLWDLRANQEAATLIDGAISMLISKALAANTPQSEPVIEPEA
jgi:hypothetical protein